MGLSCSEFVCNSFKDELHDLLVKLLPSKAEWSLEIDPNDPDRQSLLFNYPISSGSEAGYIKRNVKIECGSRSDQWPVEEKTIKPFIAEMIPLAMASAEIRVQSLKAERTFWEKATILHAYANFPDGKKLPARQSRHYYDFFKLLGSEVMAKARNDTTLLARVAKHKSIYFRSSWASYDQAKKGSLKLVPPAKIEGILKTDYRDMGEMFYADTPNWSEIVSAIEKFENSFNSD